MYDSPSPYNDNVNVRAPECQDMNIQYEQKKQIDNGAKWTRDTNKTTPYNQIEVWAFEQTLSMPVHTEGESSPHDHTHNHLLDELWRCLAGTLAGSTTLPQVLMNVAVKRMCILSDVWLILSFHLSMSL